MAFASFPIDPALKSAVAGLNFTVATEVQRQTIPAMLAGIDGVHVCVCAYYFVSCGIQRFTF